MKQSFLFLIIIIVFTSINLYSESHISYMEGSITISRGTSELEAEIGSPLFEGDVLQSGPDSLAVLVMEKRGTLKMRESTIIRIDDLGDQMTVSLDSGGLFSKIKKLLGLGYQVKTPTAVAGVRGTEFFMAYGRKIENTPDIWLCVNEGSVEVKLNMNEDSQIVDEGEGINILAGNRLTEPKFFPWTEDLNWNTDPRQGDIKDNTDLSAAYADLRSFDYD